MNAMLARPVTPVLGRLMRPLAGTLAVLMLAVAALLWHQQELRVREGVARHITEVSDRLRIVQEQQIQVMSALLEVITADRGMHAALRARDRGRLLEGSQSIYEALRREHGITHFYFHGPDRHNILRVQFPQKTAGHIDRHIVREAERTGKPVGGFEFGSFGLLTLRVVWPVYSDGTLIGYVELGRGIEDILRDLRVGGAVELAIIVHKSMLTRESLETGMELLGQRAEWDRYPDDVLTYSSLKPLPEGLLETHLHDYGTHHHGRLDLHAEADARSWRVAFTPLTDASGRDVGDVIIMLDITDEQAAFLHTAGVAGTLGGGVLILLLVFLYGLLKKTDRQLLAQQAALHRTEALRKAMFETVVDGVILIDERGRIELFNPAAEAIFGYRADEAIGQSVNMLMPSPYRDAHDGYMQRYLQGGEAQIIGIGREVQGRRKDGSLFPMDLAISETHVDGRRLFSGLVRDITERKTAEWELVKARESAELASRAKSDFLSRMSHELRTPMNAILGFGQILETDPNLDAAQRDSVQEILKSGRHLLALINEVLDLARVEAGGLAIEPEPVACRTMVESCLAIVRPLAAQRDIALEADIADDCVVTADPLRLRQVLLNLLSNAIKYNREAGSVRVTCRAPVAGLVRISVIDSGFGIDERAKPRLFQPFERLESSYTGIEGAGIGLALSKRLVEAMHGSIGVDSVPGAGSTFWIELPRAAQSQVPAAAHGADTTLPAPCAAQRPQTLLCVEDNPANLRLFRRILSGCPGLTLLDAHNAELGIELAREHRPDLILMDVGLPGMDGFEALRILRADPQLRDIPVVAISANAMQRDIERGRAAGFADYLIKPIDVAGFHAAVDRWLGRGSTDDHTREGD